MYVRTQGLGSDRFEMKLLLGLSCAGDADLIASNIELADYLHEIMRSIPKMGIYGPAPSRTVHRDALCAFNVGTIQPTNIAAYLAWCGDQIRSSLCSTSTSPSRCKFKCTC
ncbi:hypothetical protein MKW98_012901 [Papaver atlanticum]|uniref:Uncharacterized protein n=1 Tax=Papaver atlanticum TaxID=357466 RepID=A0AAD4XGI5_9MAGN|nr:hypothetical protein MKW98_012901 [Papaver atlanticum]